MRSLVQSAGPGVSSLWILAGYARTILAGMAAEHQALPALLHLLCAALSTSGCPEGIVSAHGAVFQAHDDVALLQAWASEPKYIERRQPQNRIAAQGRCTSAWPIFRSSRLARWRRCSAYRRVS